MGVVANKGFKSLADCLPDFYRVDEQTHELPHNRNEQLAISHIDEPSDRPTVSTAFQVRTSI